jgi:colanic acid biosynthesis glycosyl transferase WcaI
VNVFNPDRGGGGAIFSDLAYGLAARGFDVTVRCAYPYYPEWKDKSANNGLAVQRYEDQGVHVERHYIYIPKNPNSLAERALYEASFFLSLLRSLGRGRFDAVMVFCPLVGAVGFAALARIIWRKPLWLNVQDLSADAAAAGGIARGKALLGLMRGVQSVLFNAAGVWSSISPVMIRRLEAIRTKGQPILYLPNWLNGSMSDAIAALPSKLGRLPQDPVRLLYAGNIGTKQDLLLFCQHLHASDAQFQFRIHGDGGRASAIRDWVESIQDPRFTFGPFMDEPDFARALNETDFFIITEKQGSGGSFIPCKTISGLSSGSPILAICDADSPLGEEMREAQPGPFFGWDELDAVPALLKSLASEPERMAQWQANAMARAPFYHRDRVIDGFQAALDQLIAGGSAALQDAAR